MTARKSTVRGGPDPQPPPAGPRLLFVDAIEGERARLLLGIEAFELPMALLPEGTKEGSWLRLGVEPAEAPADDDEGSSLRQRLERDDDGGDIKL